MSVNPTPYGVYYNIEDSPYRSIAGGMEFCFSSKHHKAKFERDVLKRQEWLTDSLSRRFGVIVDCYRLAPVQLYQQIEKRGFRVRDVESDVLYTTPSQLKFKVSAHG